MHLWCTSWYIFSNTFSCANILDTKYSWAAITLGLAKNSDLYLVEHEVKVAINFRLIEPLQDTGVASSVLQFKSEIQIAHI